MALVALGACTRDRRPSSPPELIGKVSLPLKATSNGHNYRLRNVSLYISGYSNGVYRSLTLVDNGTDASLSAELPTGDYNANLSGSFVLELLDDGTGNYSPVRSQLPQPYLSFSIYSGTTTTLTFRFETDGIVVTTGSGSLTAKIDVTETARACQPFSTTCGLGRWCPPYELTGAAPGCVTAGTARLGAACSGPTNCGANASCFDFGSGPVCAALCPSSLFNQACPTGGSCVPAGTTYGVCEPGSGDGGTAGVGDAGAGDAAEIGGEPTTCDLCTFGPPSSPRCASIPEGCLNCVEDTDSCDGLASAEDRRLCQGLYACFIDNACTSMGDPLPCWCGTNPLTCVTSNTPPTKANGPCVGEILAASKLAS